MPIDADPVADGNVLMTGRYAETRNGGTVPVVRVEVDAPLFDDGTPRYVAHFATCPDADSWRRSDG